MAVRDIILLGDPRLYEPSQLVKLDELKDIEPLICDLHDTLIDCKNKYGIGRAIAAPQIGVMKRLIYMYIDNQPVVLINPDLTFRNNGIVEVWDDCLSFPGLKVKVQRYKKCHIEFRDLNWKKYLIELEGDLSELLQHECDHLNGVLAISRAIDDKSFAVKSEVLHDAVC